VGHLGSMSTAGRDLRREIFIGGMGRQRPFAKVGRTLRRLGERRLRLPVSRYFSAGGRDEVKPYRPGRAQLIMAGTISRPVIGGHLWTMKNKLILATLTLAVLTPLSALAGGIDVNLFGEIRLGSRPPPPPPVVVVVTPDPTPTRTWEWETRSRWRSRSYAYFYYPGGNAYYRSSDRMWFYQDRGRWRSNRRLPDSIRVDFNQSVTLNMYTDRPYNYHQQVTTRYPSNYFGARVRVRDDDRRDNDHDRRDNDHDRGRGNDRDRDHDNRGKDKDRDGRK
jgi:hypothetical protein